MEELREWIRAAEAAKVTCLNGPEFDFLIRYQKQRLEKLNQPKMSQIKLSPRIEKAVETFHDASMKRMAEANAADEPKEHLFHYTSEKALFGIIESEKFWFTSIYHMDDKEELTFGFNTSRSLLQTAFATGDQLTRMFCEELVGEEDLKKIRTLFEFYSISFGLKDDPQQWARYGDSGRGAALGLAPAFFHPAPSKTQRTLGPRSTSILGRSFMGIGQRGRVIQL